MNVRRYLTSAAAALVLLPGHAFADPPDEKSREDALFGEEEHPELNKEPLRQSPDQRKLPGAATATEEVEDLDARGLGGAAKENTELLTRDRLQIGGFFYARNSLNYAQGAPIGDTSLGQTTLFDTYFDGRINERVRAFARARVLYNPMADVASTSPFAFGASNPAEARFLLDQLWLKTDIGRRVFITLGQQHLRWGATHVWNPVDVINPTKFNPLTFFDERVGVPMLKVTVPLEKQGWNWYGLLLTDNAVTVKRIGVASRFEMSASSHFGDKGVLSGEGGLTVKAQKGQDPKAGLDASITVDDFDFIGEFGASTPWDVPAGQSRALTWTVAGGATWTWAYREDDTLMLSTEYFHNPAGVTAAREKTDVDAALLDYATRKLAAPNDPTVTPHLPAYTPLYTGRDYLAVVATVISPGNWIDSSITLLGIENLSDKSGLARLSLSTLALTDLTLEMFVSGSWGDGELRGLVPLLQSRIDAKIPDIRAFAPDQVPQVQAIRDSLHAPLLGVGFNLRVTL
jgi:hypothetical protein